jgi:hypothetical protein
VREQFFCSYGRLCDGLDFGLRFPGEVGRNCFSINDRAGRKLEQIIWFSGGWRGRREGGGKMRRGSAKRGGKGR